MTHPYSPEAIEQEHAHNVEVCRAVAHLHLRNAASQLRLLDAAVKRLGESDLYDVEFEGHEVMFVNARAQIDVAMAALTHLIPTPEEG